jgi:hypothetical protein
MRGVRSKVLVTALLVALLGAGGAAHAADPVLTGDVGQSDSFTISLVDPSGAPVKHLDPGSYTLLIHDHSSFHNFHLSGPGVDVTTEIDGIGDWTFTVTFVDGTYFFQCDPHAGQMKGSFTVGTAAPPPTPPPPSAPPPPSKLAGSIGPGTRFALGRPAALAAGAAVITVKDRSAADGFRLAGPGVSKATGAKFQGTVTWKVTLKAGTYRFGSLKDPKRRRPFTVS